MPTIDAQSPIAALAALKMEWPKQKWTWDGRLLTVCSSFGADVAPQACAVTERVLPRRYDSTTVTNAPTHVLALVERSGGLRGNQLAFCSDASEQMFFALWWPWAGGGTVSLRVGLVAPQADAVLTTQLRQLFAVDG